jgi:hypothetical protein
MVRIQDPFNPDFVSLLLICEQAASYGANYSQGTAGGAGAGFLSPAESFDYGDATWPDTPYVSISRTPRAFRKLIQLASLSSS